jgi:DNA polymerase-3 subunit epsilon
MPGIRDRCIAETPVAVIDFETTGLTPGFDRVVEASVVRIDPGDEPKLVFDTLVNPDRPMAATEIHGITDADVARAPRFRDIAGNLLDATKGCVVSAYNVYFDIKFLSFELANCGIAHLPPYLCLMYLRPLLGLGPKCKLDEACRLHGVEYRAAHVASVDAEAAGRLFRRYQAEIDRRRIRTFDELARLKSYKFLESFNGEPFPDPARYGLACPAQTLSRAGAAAPVDPTRYAFGAYWDALKTVCADLEITDDELAYVAAERERVGLKPEQIRMLHARAFASVVAQFTSDHWLDDAEVVKLQRFHRCLERLGWAPGL